MHVFTRPRTRPLGEHPTQPSTRCQTQPSVKHQINQKSIAACRDQKDWISNIMLKNFRKGGVNKQAYHVPPRKKNNIFRAHRRQASVDEEFYKRIRKLQSELEFKRGKIEHLSPDRFSYALGFIFCIDFNIHFLDPLFYAINLMNQSYYIFLYFSIGFYSFL